MFLFLPVCRQGRAEVDQWIRRSHYLCDHLASRLGPLSVSCPFVFAGQNSFSGGPILKRELADDPTERRHFNVPNRRGRLTQEQQEGVEPAGGGGESVEVHVQVLDPHL